MSALSAQSSTLGTVSRRSPGNRLRVRISGLASRLASGRARYFIPPLIAGVVVAAIWIGNAGSPGGQPGTANLQLPSTDLSVPGAPAANDVVPLGGVDTSDTDRKIAFWQARLQVHPESATDWVVLGDLFDLKGHQTGDVAQYLSAKQAYEQAIAVNPNATDAHADDARILSTLHDFSGALTEATTVLEINPDADGALGVVFDACVELGDMANAQLALDKLSIRLPGTPSVMARQARLIFLRGDTPGAAAQAHAAADSSSNAGSTSSTIALYDFTAAEYDLMAGNLDAAEAGYENALGALPGYPVALYGEARVAYARGDLDTAISTLETATAALPRPDMLAFLGDLYALKGDSARAQNEYATVDFIAGLVAQSGGKVYDREYELYLADHGQNLDHALSLTQTELETRKDIYGYDAVAWTLHAEGRDAEALSNVQQALALNTTDPKLLLHAGLIELANGLTDQGKRNLQQAFDLHVAVSPLVVDATRKALGQ